MKRFMHLFSFSVLVMTAANTQAQDLFIAGSTPAQRPPNAPEIQAYHKTQDWYQRALHGIVPPYPNTLQFLEQQGAWYTPFNHPGMTGPYDIRDWHVAP